MNTKFIALIATAIATIAVSLPANARLPEAFSNLPKEIIRPAVHLPTGCMAQVTLLDRHIVTAHIIDPDCLPKGVKARPIPGQNADFSFIDGAR